jgi:hypothetical protein
MRRPQGSISGNPGSSGGLECKKTGTLPDPAAATGAVTLKWLIVNCLRFQLFVAVGGDLVAGTTVTMQPTPEPSTLALLGSGTLGFLACQWRRLKAKV